MTVADEFVTGFVESLAAALQIPVSRLLDTKANLDASYYAMVEAQRRLWSREVELVQGRVNRLLLHVQRRRKPRWKRIPVW